MNIAEVKTHRAYRHVDGRSRWVKVTRIWTDDDGTRVAFDIFGRDRRGRPVTMRSALRIDNFAKLYGPT
ncbi:hypothetical protein ABR737_01505 [Streptomyces sp. Edi2]|uniref:hypothetical protein n=1 Tax=Streptomyces sp. Edi2 TaxID=3162528 RepID=UPI003305E3EE